MSRCPLATLAVAVLHCAVGAKIGAHGARKRPRWRFLLQLSGRNPRRQNVWR
jgi:hypothetical protein